MPDLLIELFSEEIPARMQARAAEDLKKLVTDRLVGAGLVYEGAKAFATPRRLALAVQGMAAQQPDVTEEKRGPRVGSPAGAIQGFLKAAGLASIDQAKVQPDKKGDFYVAVIEKKGRPAIEVIGEIVPEVVKSFPWPKTMRWGTGRLTWVRPLHSIVATFGPETEEPEIVPFAIDGIAAGDTTQGHRFLAPGAIQVKRLDDYMAKLEKAKVVLDPARRQEIILADAKNLAFAQGFELVEDAALLAEVAGLVEWPVVLMGSFEESFLEIPAEVIRATIRINQKCFVVRSALNPPLQGEGGRAAPGWGSSAQSERTAPTRSAAPTDLPPAGGGEAKGSLVNKFILVSNIEASDGGKAIVAGNERVIRARLSDAKFFYETDLKVKLEDWLEKFKQIVFHEKLGTQAERIDRIERLSAELAPLVGADVEKTKRAARLCKADLLTEVVGEFPEVQGLMGRYYAQAQGEDEAVAHAIEDHYRPKGPDDLVPSDPVSIAVALADKIDTLVGFWAIDEKPTGSKDPYALRRAALGIIRLLLENELRLDLRDKLWESHNIHLQKEAAGHESELKRQFVEEHDRAREHLASLGALDGGSDEYIHLFELLERVESIEKLPDLQRAKVEKYVNSLMDRWWHVENQTSWSIARSLMEFFADRLKVQLREQGARHDLVDAVFALEGQDDLLLIVRRVEALGKFLDTEDGKNLLAGTKRAANILRIEEKKDARDYVGRPDPSFYRQDEEWALAKAIDAAKEEAAAAVAREDFEAAMRAMAKLRPHVDAFFDKVTVNVDDKPLRENRLRLLNEIREATRTVADFSRIEG